jgi:iron complex outermembrane recepter protein
MKFSPTALSLAIACAIPMSTIATSSSAEDFMLEEIIVTAEKREAGLQDTAIAVSAFNGDELAKSGIEDALDLQKHTPNLMVGANSNITMRGIGNSVLSTTADTGVGVHQNSVYLQRNIITGDLYDMERVEVLRGPQGTLFGRNTTGGVINYITHKPTDEFSFNISAQIENNNGLRTTGTLNLPISDSVKQRLAFSTVNRDGYTKNEFTGNDIDGREQFSVRSSTLVEFTETFDALLTVEHAKEDSTRLGIAKMVCDPDPTYGCSDQTSEQTNDPLDYGAGNVDNTLLSLGILKPNRYSSNGNPSDLRSVNFDLDPEYFSETTFSSLELNYDLGDYTLTAITGFHNARTHVRKDYDRAAAPNAFNVVPGWTTDDGNGNGVLTYLQFGEYVSSTDYSPTSHTKRKSEQYSQEIRLASSHDGPFNFLTGVYWTTFDQEFWDATCTPALTNTTVGFGCVTNQTFFESKSIAAFGEIYYDLTEDLALTVGLRYTKDDKEAKAGANFTGPIAESAFNTGKATWEEMTGKINLSYNADFSFTDDTLIYATLSRGYKGGGLNPSVPSEPTYDPEYVNALEIGTKNRMLENRLQFNASVFYYDFSDYQLGGLIGISAVNTNAEKVEIQGAEFELVWLPIQGLQINANLSFIDTEIKEDFIKINPSRPRFPGDAGEPENLKGRELPYSPNKSLSLGIEYTHELIADWDIRYRADYYWQDDFHADVHDNFNYPSWSRVDARISLLDHRGTWSVDAYVNNLTDEDSITGAQTDNALTGRFRTLQLMDPRTYGVGVSYNF